jgi:hypothetical protein
VPAYLSKPPSAVTRIDPHDARVSTLLAEIDAANPPPLERVWEGKGRHRTARLQGICPLSSGQFLHVPWLRQPRRSLSQAFWLGLAGVATVAVGGVLVAAGGLIRAVVFGGLTFTGIVSAGYRLRANDSRRAVVPDGGPGLPGFICLPDRMLIRYPDALYEFPRAQIWSICRRDRPHAQGDTAMAEYEMRAEIGVGRSAAVELVLAEVVELSETTLATDTGERMAILLALVDWLESEWRTGKPR